MSDHLLCGHWPPLFRMSRHNIFPALEIDRAEGCWLITKDGRQIFDGTSSWWCKHLGHKHPSIVEAIDTQAKKYIHAIGANTYSAAIQGLSRKLTNIYPKLNKVSYASDGSSAVEIAIKMAFHTRRIIYPDDKRTKILKLAGAYHGETMLAMSVSDCDMYKRGYESILVETFTCPLTASSIGKRDLKWLDSDAAWENTYKYLETIKNEVSVLIIEPILQAANNMHIYSPDFLDKLAAWAQENSIDVIADEIMTGFWRTGKLMAFEYCNFVPDFVCLGKGLTAGTIPMSAVLTSQNRFTACYPASGPEKAFMHSHTYSSHALAAAAALAAINIYLDPEMQDKIKTLEDNLLECFLNLPKLTNVRSVGCVVAAEIDNIDPLELQKIAADNGLLIRPLDNTIYLCPPLITNKEEVDEIFKSLDITISSMN